MPVASSGLLQLSDLHLRVGPGDGDSSRRVEAVVAGVARLSIRPVAALLSGDLVEVASPRAYERVAELLAPLDLPLHAVPGNHDDREQLRAAFPPAGDPGTGSDPVQLACDCGSFRLLACDSTVPGHPGGRLEDGTLAWLDAELNASAAVPTLVALHHPPILTGIRALDDIGLPGPDRAALAEVLARHAHVAAVLCGHVHRAVTGRLGSTPVLIGPGISSELELDLHPDHDWRFRDAPPAFALHVLLDGGIVSHVQSVEPIHSPSEGSRI